MTDLNVPVLIVGGGGGGLTASMTLSRLGIEHVLISSLAHTSILPKAHVVSQRSMEILGDLGVADAVLEHSTPAENMISTGWYAGFAGDHAGYGRRLGRLEVWGAGYTDPDYVAASPYRTCNLPQIRLEPLLRARAEELNPGKIRYHHELLHLVQDADGVTATVKDKDNDVEYTVRSRYLIGADGGRTVPKQVGIGMTGPRDILKMVSVHMTADLSPWCGDDDTLIRWLVNPSAGGSFASGILVPMGPDNWGSHSEEWVFHMQYATDDPDAMQDDKVLERLRATLGLPDFDPYVHKISSWSMEGVIADQFREGSVFLVGDAAHRHPPTGGLGLNSAIQDAHNLSWKLAYVLTGKAGEALLNTYESERKPVDEANVASALASAMNHFTIDQALQISPDKSAEENWAELWPIWDDRLPDSAKKRHALNQAIVGQTMEFHHHNVDYGYRYTEGAIVDDGSPEHVALDPVRLYEPSTKPGHPLPHAFVERENQRIALGSLARDGRFLVIAGEEGDDWVKAAEQLAADHGIDLMAITIGVLGSDFADVRLSWLKHRGISSHGVVVVRPDRVVAYRSAGETSDPYAALTGAFDLILSRTSI